jgi:hypothetical protein
MIRPTESQSTRNGRLAKEAINQTALMRTAIGLSGKGGGGHLFKFNPFIYFLKRRHDQADGQLKGSRAKKLAFGWIGKQFVKELP